MCVMEGLQDSIDMIQRTVDTSHSLNFPLLNDQIGSFNEHHKWASLSLCALLIRVKSSS